jgi:uncharacterized membrane protein
MARRGIAAAALSALALVAAPAAAAAKEAKVTDADARLRLAPDASLLVNERLTFDYDGDFQASYRELELNFGERVGDVAVSEPGGPRYRPGGCAQLGCFDPFPNRYGVAELPDGVRIVWHHKASDEERTFDISYRVIDAVVAYDDVLDVRWQVWGSEWDQRLPELTASLADRALDPDDERYRVWGYPREVQSGETERDPGVARLTATDIPAGQFVELRVLVPRTPGQNVSAARVKEGDGLGKILAEEGAKDDDYRYSWARLERFLGENAPLLSLIVAALALGFLAVLWLRARERPTSVPKYLPGPPDNATSPALAYALAEEGEGSTDTVLATLLDLVDRGYYDVSSATTEDEKLDLAITKSEQRPADDELATHERITLSFFDELIDDKTVALSEMKDLIPKHDAGWRTRWTTMTKALDEVEGGELEWDRSYAGWELVALLPVGAAFVLLAIASVEVRGNLIWPLVIGIPTCLALLVYPSNSLKRLSAKSRERNASWKAFARWTDDFPRLDDDPPATLALWKRILVYAVAFGTAERMIESGRIPAPVTAEATSGVGWSAYAFTGSTFHSLDGSSFGSSFSSHVAPESSSSGGGGGFSGGGGGASGGGGGGSW